MGYIPKQLWLTVNEIYTRINRVIALNTRDVHCMNIHALSGGLLVVGACTCRASVGRGGM